MECTLCCYTTTAVVVALGVTLSLLWTKYIAPLLRLLHLLILCRIYALRHCNAHYTIADLFEQQCDAHPLRVQAIFADSGESRTLRQWDELASQFARFALQKGCRQRDTLAVMLLNSLDYAPIWIGMTKIGCSCALGNTNLAGKPFLHSVETSLASSECKMVLLDYELVTKLTEEIEILLSKGIQVLVWKNNFVDGDEAANNDTFKRTPIINKLVTSFSKERLGKAARDQVKENDAAIFIFTSGTTGLPKACKISHTRFMLAAYFFPVLGGVVAGDCLYCPLPLYHSAAGMLALGGCIRGGACLLTRSKFSASNFSSDCVKYNVTAFQYIGELCRYLTTSLPNAMDSKVKLRVAFGNGMRKEYWTLFKERYTVDTIVEFYAATEGNVGLVNGTGQVGALGFVPRFLDFLYPLLLCKVDPDDNSKPLRNEHGKLQLCKPNEPGLLLSKIGVNPNDVNRRFDGYTDSKATNEKILRDAFVKGDAYFNTGDLISRDELGFFYWSDRTGDTFRWKGENCSTTEVSEVLSSCNVIKDVVVYGVAVPNTDGRAGMAAVVATNEDNSLDFEEIVSATSKHLPVYARPLFLRIKKDRVLPTTSTHKYIKTALVKEGFDPASVGEDELYYLNAKTNQYIKITTDVFGDIMSGKIRF